MCSISSNHCDMRQHMKGMTSSNTTASSFDLHFKDYSKFLHSVDSRHMVKNLCASQDYFQWGVFLAFTYNMRKHFGIKPIREWIDNNEWIIYFPNWDTYSFSAARNKKSFTSICFGPISKSLGRSQCYFY